MGKQKYLNPPITEAVIEIRFATPINEQLQLKLSDRLAKQYPQIQNLTTQRMGVDPVGHSVAIHIDGIIRRSNADMDEFVIIGGTNFIVSKLAPYAGWDVFFERFQQDWLLVKKAYKYQKIARIGLRFINRLDLPITNRMVKEEEYINVSILSPEILENKIGYTLQLAKPIDKIKSILTFNSASVLSPIPNCLAIVLDIDIGRDIEIPQNDNDMFALISEMRLVKNEVFEACITDKARERFQDVASLS